jgi:hypothetical protein
VALLYPPSKAGLDAAEWVKDKDSPPELFIDSIFYKNIEAG